MSHDYKLCYKIETEIGHFTKEEATKFGGGADALVLISILYPEDGSYSQAVISKDGRDGNTVLPKDLFKAWLILGASLGDNAGLDPLRQKLARIPMELFRQFTS